MGYCASLLKAVAVESKKRALRFCKVDTLSLMFQLLAQVGVVFTKEYIKPPPEECWSSNGGSSRQD